MLLGFNGATTMKADMPSDIAAASGAGFKALEIWAEKLDAYLVDSSPDQLKALFAQHSLLPASINSIEFITFRPQGEFEAIRARCQELCTLGQTLGCDTIVVVPSPTPLLSQQPPPSESQIPPLALGGGLAAVIVVIIFAGILLRGRNRYRGMS